MHIEEERAGMGCGIRMRKRVRVPNKQHKAYKRENTNS